MKLKRRWVWQDCYWNKDSLDEKCFVLDRVAICQRGGIAQLLYDITYSFIQFFRLCSHRARTDEVSAPLLHEKHFVHKLLNKTSRFGAILRTESSENNKFWKFCPEIVV